MYGLESFGLGDVWSAGKSCPQMDVTVPAADFVLRNASSAELLALERLANDEDTKFAIRTRNAVVLGWHLAGGDDCYTGTTRGQAFNAAFLTLKDVVEGRTGVACDFDPVTQVYTCPPIEVGGGSGGPNPTGNGDAGDTVAKSLPWILGGIGLFFLLQGDRQRARRR